jgi:hypothetical protein
MRKAICTILTGTAIVIALPTSALARQHHRRHHGTHAHHARVHHIRFGSDSSTTSSTGSSAPDAGTVASFSGGVLTISLSDGSSVQGAVTDATELECRSAAGGDAAGDNEDNQASTMTARRDGPDGSSGSGDESRGDDNSSEDNGSEDNSGDSGDDNAGDGQNQPACTTSDLTPGTVVQEAELSVSRDGSTWRKVELITP